MQQSPATTVKLSPLQLPPFLSYFTYQEKPLILSEFISTNPRLSLRDFRASVLSVLLKCRKIRNKTSRHDRSLNLKVLDQACIPFPSSCFHIFIFSSYINFLKASKIILLPESPHLISCQFPVTAQQILWRSNIRKFYNLLR